MYMLRYPQVPPILQQAKELCGQDHLALGPERTVNPAHHTCFTHSSQKCMAPPLSLEEHRFPNGHVPLPCESKVSSQKVGTPDQNSPRHRRVRYETPPAPPSLLGWRPLLLGWRPLLLGWRPSLLGRRPLLLGWKQSNARWLAGCSNISTKGGTNRDSR